MTTPSLATENQTFRQLMTNGSVYQVPAFQRDYSWSEEQWEDLWLDCLAIVQEEQTRPHYMGHLVLQQNGQNRSRLIIDGQQRLTTLTIFILAALRVLKSEGSPESQETDRQRIDEICRIYAGSVDTVSLNVNPKLTLNRNDDGYFQTYVLPLRPLPARNLNASDHRMRKASEFFECRIRNHLRATESSGIGEATAALVEKIADSLFFTVINVTDELNAYAVFETLNARGVKLAAPDLLKNYFFAVISRNVRSQDGKELDDLDKRWSDILNRLGSETLTAYLRTWWGSRHSFVRKADLFKTIRREVTERAEVYDIINGLEDDLDIYLALTNPEISGFEDRARANALRLKLFNVRQPLSLLMAVHRMLPGEFSRLLEAIVNISFRYNVIGSQSTAEQERTYANVATQVAKGTLGKRASILQELSGIYLSDTAFEGFFREKTFDTGNSRNKRVVKYILGQLETRRAGLPGGPDTESMSLEHILPESPGNNWPEFSEQQYRSSIHRIGNMTPLEESLNTDVGSKDFARKRVAYRKSNSLLTRQVAEHEEWTPDEVHKRQAEFAELAKTLWRVDPLG